MKERTGFVSNSSSTSFMVVGRKLSAADLDGKGYCDFHSAGTPPHFVGTGRELSSGIDMFDVTPDMFGMVKELVSMGEGFELYAAACVVNMEYSGTEDMLELVKDKGSISGALLPEHRVWIRKYSLSADNNRCGSAFDFMWRYHRTVDEEDDDDWGNDWEYISGAAHDMLETNTRLKEL